ncbi:MAG TPA: hypothetical protein VFV40_02380 [Nocardioides sp.]|nr:hypothetical protein [Nocardioides sp.]
MRTSRVRRVGLTLVLVLAVVAGVGVLMLRGVGPLPDPEGCEARVGGVRVWLDTDQAENAATIAAIGVRRGLPARAVSIALATAYQESKIRNLDYGDRDSVGIFQQRPSQGWGDVDQLQDVYYATNAFYDELVKVDGYETMRITEAAQRVQRSGFPEAYEDHAEDGRVLASALTGYSQGRFSCVVRGDAGGQQRERANGLTKRADRVLRDLQRAFGSQSTGGFSPGGVDDGHMEGSAHYDGRAVDVFFRPITPENQRRGWALAHYLVAHADRLQIRTVIYDGRIWSEGIRSEQRWRQYDPPSRSGARAILEHRDHVHVDVLED